MWTWTRTFKRRRGRSSRRNAKKMRKLKSSTSNTPFFTLDGTNVCGKIVYVYDGDTVHAVFGTRGGYDKWRCRILGIDTPELRGGTIETKIRARESRDFLRELINDKIVYIKCHDFDAFGRVLVEIFIDGRSVADILIRNELAKPYLFD